VTKQPGRRQPFWVSVFGLVLYTAICGVIPFVHQFTGRDMKPALMLNIDSVLVFIFLLGTGTIVAILALNRRIATLEKKSDKEEED